MSTNTWTMMKKPYLIKDVPVRIGSTHYLSSNDSSLSFEDGYRIGLIPYIAGIENKKLSDLIHYFLVEQLYTNLLDLSSHGRAFLTWVTWLQTRNVDPFSAPPLHRMHPTYGFRNYLVERTKVNSEDDGLASSTASTYINHIKSFYAQLDRLGIVKASEFYQQQTSLVNGHIPVQTSNLSISRVSTKEKSLNPLSELEYTKFLTALSNTSADFNIMCRFLVFSGLRLQEMLTLPRTLFDEAVFASTESQLVRGLIIGKKVNNVNTKFGKPRELFVSKQLYEGVLNFLLDEQTEKRLQKWRSRNGDHISHEPLFITRMGTSYTDNAFYSRWYPFVEDLRETHHQQFKHKPHDLRATFGTSFLKSATNSGVSVTAALGALKVWMGHSQLETTMQYVRYLERTEISNVVAQVMDSFISEASISHEVKSDD